MNTIVMLKMVPDVVEELVVAADGKSLDQDTLRMILSEPSDHALEQALLLKEKHGGRVTAVTLAAPEVDEALFKALAKGADQAIKLNVDQTVVGSLATARALASWLRADPQRQAPDTLLLTGSYAIDDLEGELGPCLAEMLQWPFVGVVTGLSLDASGQKVAAIKEFFGGLRGEYEVSLPAVIGIQAAARPPRYVPIAKIRSFMKSATLGAAEVAPPDPAFALDISRMYIPEATGRAVMVEGSPEEVSRRIVEILHQRGIV